MPMRIWSNTQAKRDLLKLGCVAATILGVLGMFAITPALSTPTLVSVVITLILSPWVAGLERRGLTRSWSIVLVFIGLGMVSGALTFWGIESGSTQWHAFQENAPGYFKATIQKLQAMESTYQARYPILKSLNLTDSLFQWGRQTGQWFVKNGPGLVGQLASCLFIVPILTFVLLNEGPIIRRRFFHLIPNRFFETIFLVTHQIMGALADYIRAKLLEAFLVALMTAVGLILVNAPYAIVLGIVAGVTNIIPYLGPVIGAVPGILIANFDPSHNSLLLPVVLVYLIANIIDMAVIFPIVVAKLVNLHPVILIAVVVLGQRYYGLVGMLISIPIAAALKVIFSEIHSAIYEQRNIRKLPSDSILRPQGVPKKSVTPLIPD